MSVARWRVAALLAAALAVAWLVGRKPAHERAWSADHAVLARPSVEGARVRVAGVRNFRYPAHGGIEPAFEERTYDLDKLRSVWFVLVPFSTRWRGPAHSFVSFGFADSQYVGISVEARRETDEAYGVLAGMFRRYELIYVIADERDLLLRRVLRDSSDVYVYPIEASPERARELFVAMLLRADELARRPEFYHTIWNNCTSNLIAHVNAIAPGRIPAGWRTLLPGYADEVALELGLIRGSGSVDDIRHRYRANERAVRYADDPAFSIRIRQPAAMSAQ
jgi:hypothetical protein